MGPKLSLREQIDTAAELLLTKAQGLNASKDGAEEALLAEHVKAFSAVVDWYKVRGGAAADVPVKESKFEQLKSDFRQADERTPRQRRGAARKAAASETDLDDAAPAGSA